MDPEFVYKKIFEPIRKVLKPLLVSIPGDPVNDPEVRRELVSLGDLALISEFPLARAIAPRLRTRLIEQVLDAVLGEAAASSVTLAAALLSPAVTIDITDNADAAALELSAPGDSVRGFMVDSESSDRTSVESAVATVLGSGWSVGSMKGTTVCFRITNPESAALSVREAWDLAHKLADQPAIAAAEPVIEWMIAPPEIGGQSANLETAAALWSGERPIPACATSPEWSLDAIQAKAVWSASSAAGKPVQGEGIKIAHIDTGLTNHTELELSDPRILINQGANFYDPQRIGDKPLDPMDADGGDVLRTWFIPQNGHGTGTLSVLLSSVGPQPGSANDQFVSGVAPRATVVPIRVGPTVVHWNLERMIKGIQHAHAAGCHVITMSMGGPPPETSALQKAVDAAVEDGVIFCSAAGNVIGRHDWFPVVVWPAALDQVIAVGGSNCQDKEWSGSSRGPEVNISAPAQDVWHAYGSKGALQPTPPTGTSSGPGCGTSFATPAVAGIAACWLAHHGRQQLINFYGHPRYIPRAFAYLLRTVAFRTPAGWKTKLLGPGIMDGAKLIAAPLPPKVLIEDWPQKNHSLSSNVLAGLFRKIYVMTPGEIAAAAAAGHALPVAAMSAQDGDPALAQARRFRGELFYHVFDRPALFSHMVQNLSVEGLNAVADQKSIAVDSTDSVRRALKMIASSTLASAIP